MSACGTVRTHKGLPEVTCLSIRMMMFNSSSGRIKEARMTSTIHVAVVRHQQERSTKKLEMSQPICVIQYNQHVEGVEIQSLEEVVGYLKNCRL
jgi:hypothetical protein